VPVRLTWAATDTGNSGLHYYVVERRVDAGAWAVAVAANPTTAVTVWASSGHGTLYRVTAVDGDGNKSSPKSTALAVKPTTLQQNAKLVHYAGHWTKVTAAAYSGGTVSASSTKSSSATFTFKGRGAAIVGTMGPGHGVVTIYVNGVKSATVNTYAVTRSDRVVLWRKQFTSTRTITVKIVVAGTMGRPRVDFDALVELR
jgi:hypothetical protein